MGSYVRIQRVSCLVDLCFIFPVEVMDAIEFEDLTPCLISLCHPTGRARVFHFKNKWIFALSLTRVNRHFANNFNHA